ncbi:3-keto-disaccharide hydrolase [Rubritalea sp.]|uniref:3-keto-disaccharide hydrolase n=1 Tax=Rubritalea sp. TaxID=2109375 RepID=UPI003EFA1ACF
MNFKTTITALISSAALSFAGETELADMSPAEGAVPIFDGSSLDGWVLTNADQPWWSVKDGSISGGSLEKNVPFNTWLVSEKEYENFELTFQIKMIDGGAPEGLLKNSGVQVRSHHKGKNVTGYQIDAGPTHPKQLVNGGLGYWGNIWDEHRRGPLVTAENQELLKESVKQFDGWNSYKVICDGKNIKTWINGILAHDYTEPDAKIPANGIIALQAHKGGKFLAQFKDVKIKELPATADSTKWGDPDMSTGKKKKKQKPSKKTKPTTTK